MKKPKIIFIGNFNEKDEIELLRCFCDRYSDIYDIMVSGYNMEKINAEPFRRTVKVNSMNSNRFFSYKHLASYVVISTPAINYKKLKNNQTIIYAVLFFKPEWIAGVIGAMDMFISGSVDSKDYFIDQYPEIHSVFIDEDNVELLCKKMTKVMKIDRTIESEPEDYLFVSVDPEFTIKKSIFGFQNYFFPLRKVCHNNLMILTTLPRGEEFTSSVLFLNTIQVKGLLQDYEGVIVFDSELSSTYFYRFLENNEIQINTEQIYYVNDLSLLPLEKQLPSDIVQVVGEERVYNEKQHINYLRALDLLYDTNHCIDYRISIIIPRFNTPIELLSRAIQSALNSGHENVEVLVIDDGSENPVGETIQALFPENKVKYYYKENEGVGPTRNYGLERASGEYVYALDADDTVRKNGLKRMLSHAVHFDLDMVVGKRIVCDEKGKTINESMGQLAGDAFMAYYSDENSSIYMDVMINNKLVRREALIKHDIFFNHGIYEDIEVSAKLYSRLPEYHYLSVPVHCWYQYGIGSTLSSNINIETLYERIEKENLAWKETPEYCRNMRLLTLLSSDFNMYLNAYFSYTDDDKELVWNGIRGFFTEKSQYLKMERYSEALQELVRAFIWNNEKYFRYVLNRYYIAEKSEEPYDNFIILTHYHLFVACLYAIKSHRKCRLFISQTYVTFDSKIIYNIRKLELFDEVKAFSNGQDHLRALKEAEKRPGEEDIVFPHFFCNRFRGIFKNCDYKNDTMYIFSDTQPYWYFIEDSFDHIVKLEDAYNSFDREVNTFQMAGEWAKVQQFEGSFFPLMNYRSEKIEKIIVSKIPDNISPAYLEKLELIDTKKVEQEYYNDIKKAMLSIYGLENNFLNSQSTLLLTQPLALFGYCTVEDQKALMEKICSAYDKSNLLIKPHPADDVDYSYLGGVVLPKSIPVEIYKYLDVQIKRVVSFGSSANETIDYADENITFFRLHDFSFQDVVDAINEIVNPQETDHPKDVFRESSKNQQKAQKRILLKIKSN